MVVWTPCVLLGIWAATAVFNGQPVIPPGTRPNAVLGTLVQKLTSPWVAGLLGVGIVSATMSLDSQFLALSSMFTHDVVLRLFGEHRFGDKQRILLGLVRVAGVVVAAYLPLAASRPARCIRSASGVSVVFPASSRWSLPHFIGSA